MNQQRPGEGLTLPGAFNLLYIVMAGYSTCLTVFVRHSFGREALGINGVAALVVLILYSSCYPFSRGMGCLLWLWFVALVMQRLCTALVYARGHWIHSHSSGYPWLGYAVPFVRKHKTAIACEFLALCALGGFLMDWDLALGQFVFFGAWTVLLKTNLDEQMERRRLFRMRDAEIEQRTLVERYRAGDF
jgi:hypothetical protein